MIQIGVATIHFSYPKCDDAELQRLGLSFLEIAENAVPEFVPFKADVIVEIEQASLKVRSKIFAAAVTVGAFLSQYGSIREGASYLSRDIRSAADFAIEKIEHSAGVRSSDVIAKRRNPTIAQRIKRVFEEVERGRIDSEKAMQQLIAILDPDAEGAVTPELIEDLNEEVASTHRNRKTRTYLFPNSRLYRMFDCAILPLKFPARNFRRVRARSRCGLGDCALLVKMGKLRLTKCSKLYLSRNILRR